MKQGDWVVLVCAQDHLRGRRGVIVEEREPRFKVLVAFGIDWWQGFLFHPSELTLADTDGR